MDFGFGFDLMSSLFPIFFVIIFVLIIGGIVYSVINHFKNANAPQESHYATIVAKRTEVRSNHNHHHHDNHAGGMHTTGSSRTHYYITLEFENGERREYLDVKKLYGLVVEGDRGYAAVQGQWIVAFSRE